MDIFEEGCVAERGILLVPWVRMCLSVFVGDVG
jgi:hypothetical protein